MCTVFTCSKWPSRASRTLGLFFSKSNGFLPGSQGRLPPKMNFIGSIYYLRYFVNGHTHRQTHRQMHLSKKPRHAKHGRGLIMCVHLHSNWHARDTCTCSYLRNTIFLMHRLHHWKQLDSVITYQKHIYSPHKTRWFAKFHHRYIIIHVTYICRRKQPTKWQPGNSTLIWWSDA